MTDTIRLCAPFISRATSHARAAGKALRVPVETREADDPDPWGHLPDYEYDNARANLTEAIAQLQRALAYVNAKQIEMLRQENVEV